MSNYYFLLGTRIKSLWIILYNISVEMEAKHCKHKNANRMVESD